MFLKISKLLWLIFLSGVGFMLLWTLSVSINLFGLFGGMPDLTKVENPKNELASELYSADGVLLGKYFRENRTPIKYTELSQNLLNALYATEDIRFEQHSGVDAKGTFAILYYLARFEKRGSSTITQQLAKNLFETRTDSVITEGTLSRLPIVSKVIAKTKEWSLAIELERAYTKKEIVTMYLNTVEFGSNAYGIKVAAKTYFNKSPDSLNLQEAAVLVGMLQAPTRYNPKTNPESALRRRNTVLSQMNKYAYLTDSQADSLKKLPIETKYFIENQNTGIATYFRTVAHNYLFDWCKKNGYDLYGDGLKIHTTINSTMQKYAEIAVEKHVTEIQARFFDHWKGKNPWVDENFKEIKGFLEKEVRQTPRYKILKDIYGDDTLSIDRELKKKQKMTVFSWTAPNHEKDTVMSPWDSVRYYKHHLHAGMMSLDPHTGHIKAWVGGINHKYFKFDNVKQGRRQPGSTFKAMVYAAAIDNGYHPCYEVVDAPISFQLPTGGTWTAKNSGGGYSNRKYTLKQALASSVNTAAAFLMERLKPSTVIEYARKLGITSPLDPVPALCLGSSDVSLYEMVGAYATFANQGTWIEPTFITRITDKNGKTLFSFVPETREALDEEKAYIMLHMLRGAVESGTASGLWKYNFRKENEVAAKTGTTSNYSDGWFMGLTKDLVTGVWVGGEKRSIHFRTGDLGQGSRIAMPAYALYTEKVFEDVKLGYLKGKFTKPDREMTIELDCSKYKNPVLEDSEDYILPAGNPLKNQ